MALTKVTYAMIDGTSINVLDFGAVGDGSTDDYAAIQAAINAASSGQSLYFPAGTYKVNTNIDVNKSNIKIYGDGNSSIITSATLKNVVYLNDISNVVFEDIKFTTTVNNSTENVYGIVWSSNQSLTNIKFNRCYFSAPTASCNGFKSVNEAAKIANSIHFTECVFKDIGRMGIEFQNHVYDSVVRYTNINVQNCKFENIGIYIYGMGVSLSGLGYAADISNNVFDSNSTYAVEIVGTNSASICNNKFVNIPTNGTALSMSGALVMSNNKLIGNSCVGNTGSNVNIYNQTNLSSSNNNWNVGNAYIHYKDCIGLRATNDFYTSSGSYAVFFESDSTDNQFVNCVFDNTASGTNFATFRCYGPTVTQTILTNCEFKQGTGGSLYDSANGADDPIIYYSTGNTTSNVISTPIQQGTSFFFGLLKQPTSAGSGSVSFSIDFGASVSWMPSSVNCRIATCSTTGANDGYLAKNIWVKYATANTLSVIATENIGTPSNLSISTSASGTVLTVTATNGSGTGTGIEFMIALEITSLNPPVVS